MRTIYSIAHATLAAAWIGMSYAAAAASLTLPPLFSDHMVLQRGKPVPVYGTTLPGGKITVTFNGQTVEATADVRGDWQVVLAPMAACTQACSLVIRTTINDERLTINDVLVGDVWLCSGQSNMDMGLGGCNRPEDIASADFPGIRSFRVPLAAAATPQKEIKGSPRWIVSAPDTAGAFSATAFYFARRIYRETKAAIPIGLIVSSVGGTSIDLWLVHDGVVDMPALHPLFSQPVLPGGPFHLGNGMIHPLAPYGIKGAIWYQGENAERTKQSPDSYYLKMQALVQGWKRLWGMDDFPFYYVMIANWGEKPKNATPVFNAGGWDADTRLQQANAMALPHAGCASALDIGDSSMGDKTWDGWHPKNKLEVGERLALWALKNDYGQPDIVASGPTLNDVALNGNTVVYSFDNIGSGLMVGSKKWYEPTKDCTGEALSHFVVAGADGTWCKAAAVIKDNKVIVSSPSVTEPRKVSYACWQNPEGCNLYNREGLPAAPFHVEDVTKHCTIAATAGEGGTISPAGTVSLPERRTRLFTIVPKPGYYIEDVKIDGVSVGSVPTYSFAPVYSNHTIEAVFSKTAPTYTVAASANEGGSVEPAGTIKVAQGRTRAFAIVPQQGMVIKSVKVDGVDIGRRDRYTFSDVRNNHRIAVSFACTIKAEAGFGGTISPCGDLGADYGDRMAFSIVPMQGFAIAGLKVDGEDIGVKKAYTFDKVTSSHAIAVKFKRTSAAAGKIPRQDKLVVACLAESLPLGATKQAWPALVPKEASLTPIATPQTVTIDDRKYSRNLYLDGDGYTCGTYTAPIACNGASVIAVARPIRNGGGSGWFSILDVFYDRLVLGIRNDSGLVCVRRNGPIVDSRTPIPDGQITILSLIVQPDGAFKVYANGSEVMTEAASGAITSLVPGVAGPFATSVTIGRNAPDAWTTFNGDIGDVFFYKVALADDERMQLEDYIAHKLSTRK